MNDRRFPREPIAYQPEGRRTSKIRPSTYATVICLAILLAAFSMMKTPNTSGGVTTAFTSPRDLATLPECRALVTEASTDEKRLTRTYWTCIAAERKASENTFRMGLDTLRDKMYYDHSRRKIEYVARQSAETDFHYASEYADQMYLTTVSHAPDFAEPGISGKVTKAARETKQMCLAMDQWINQKHLSDIKTQLESNLDEITGDLMSADKEMRDLYRRDLGGDPAELPEVR